MEKNIKSMNNEELLSYKETAKKQIEDLLKQYQEMYNKKIEEINDIEDLQKSAFEMKKVLDEVQWDNEKVKLNKNSSDKNSIVVKRGEIWTAKLGMNIGSEENKLRPVIVIQNNTGNEKGPTTICVPISNRPRKIATYIVLRQSDYVLVEGEKGLRGTVLCEQIKTVSKARLGRKIGTITVEFMRILNSTLNISLDLKK